MSKVTTEQPDRVTQAEFARMCDVSRKTVTKWKGHLVVMDGDLVNVPASLAKLKMYRDRHDGRAARGAKVKIAAGADRIAPTPLARGALIERLKALDWSTPFNPEAIAARLEQAALCVGFVLVTSPVVDDGHHGGFQVRSAELLQRHGGMCTDAVVAGFGFELDAFDVLTVCREHVWHRDDGVADLDDLMPDVRPDLLPALAWPFNECQTAP